MCGAGCGPRGLAAGMLHARDAHAAALARPAALLSPELQLEDQAGPLSRSKHAMAASGPTLGDLPAQAHHTCFYELSNEDLGDSAHDDGHVQVHLLPHNGLLQLYEAEKGRSERCAFHHDKGTLAFGSALARATHPFHVAPGQRRSSERFVSVELLFCEQLQDAPAK